MRIMDTCHVPARQDRKKDGKEHRYFSVVENHRVRGGRVVQRHVLYLGEINSSQELAWRKSIEVLDERSEGPRTLALFPEDLRTACCRMSRWCGCGCRRCGSCDRGNGAAAGWRCSCGASWSWMSSGRERLLPSRKGTRWERGVADPGGVSAALARQRVAAASGVVWTQCAGGSSGDGSVSSTSTRSTTATICC